MDIHIDLQKWRYSIGLFNGISWGCINHHRDIIKSQWKLASAIKHGNAIYPRRKWKLRPPALRNRYPLVNVNKKLWKDPPFLMGKSTINCHFQ